MIKAFSKGLAGSVAAMMLVWACFEIYESKTFLSRKPGERKTRPPSSFRVIPGSRGLF